MPICRGPGSTPCAVRYGTELRQTIVAKADTRMSRLSSERERFIDLSFLLRLISTRGRKHRELRGMLHRETCCKLSTRRILKLAVAIVNKKISPIIAFLTAVWSYERFVMHGRHKWRRSLADSLARLSLVLLSVFLFHQFIFPLRLVAQVIVRGVVRNGTTGQLQAGDDVSLLLGSNDIGHLRSGKDGQFEFVNSLAQPVPKDALSVRAIHGGIAYEQTIRFGGSVVLTVFDTSSTWSRLCS